MKKFFLLSVFACLSIATQAQLDNKFSIKGGIGLSSVVGSDADLTKYTIAYKVGVSYDWALTYDEFERPKFFIIPGIEFVKKGFKSEGIDGSINMNYLQIPILAGYKHSLNEKLGLIAKVGPYFSYGLFGSDIEWYDIYGNTLGKTNVFDGDTGYKRFDVGLLAGVAVEFDRFSVGFDYSRGFIKLDSGYKQFNQAFWLAVCCKL